MTAGEWVRKAPSTAQRRLARGAQRVAQFNTQLIKMTHDSTPVYASTWFEWLREETRGLWTCVRLQCTTHFEWVNMWTKVHHVVWKSLVRIFSLAPKLSGLRRCSLHFKPNFKFSRLKIIYMQQKERTPTLSVVLKLTAIPAGLRLPL